MTVTAQLPIHVYTAAAGATLFAYQFRIFDAGDLAITVDGDLAVLNTDYTVTGVDVAGGGNVTFLTPMAGGEEVVIAGDAPVERETNYQEGGDLLGKTHNDDHDYPIVLIKQILARALLLPVGDPTSGTLPAAVDRVLKTLTTDAQGRIQFSDPLSLGTTADASMISFTPAGPTAIPTTVRSRLRKTIYTSDYPDIQEAYDQVLAAGGTMWLSNGVHGPLSVTADKPIRIIGESAKNSIIQRTTGAAGLYALSLDCYGSARPLSTVIENITVKGKGAAVGDRIYHGILLKYPYQARVNGLYVHGVDVGIMGRACFYGHLGSIWIDDFNTGIRGYDGAESLNSNKFSAVHFIEGNSEGTAIPYDGTYAGANKWDVLVLGSSPSKPMDQMISGSKDQYNNLRLESITSANNWVRVRDNCTFNDPEIGSQVAVAAGKAPFSIVGSGNTINNLGSGTVGTPLVRFELNSSYNKVFCPSSLGVVSVPWLDFGTFNDKHLGTYHEYGNARGSCGRTVSDDDIENLFINSIDLSSMVPDGLAAPIPAANTGVDQRGGVFAITIVGGNRQIYQDLGAVLQNSCYCMSFEVQAVGVYGGLAEHYIKAAYSENLLADYPTSDVMITSNQWLRVYLFKKFIAGWANSYFGIQLPAAHPGILFRNPLVNFIGINAVSGELGPYTIGGMVRTSGVVRRARPDGDPWKFGLGVPGSGRFSRGDRIINIAAAAAGDIPSVQCTVSGSPGTWESDAVLV